MRSEIRSRRKLHNVNSKKQGFTLAEVVITIAIIMIVSITALSTVVSVSGITDKNNKWYRCNSMANNVVECFRYADNAAKFNAGMAVMGFTADPGDTLDETLPNDPPITSWRGEWKYSFDSENEYNAQVLIFAKKDDVSGEYEYLELRVTISPPYGENVMKEYTRKVNWQS